MTKKRGFEVVSRYQDKGINLPKRATTASAGYDIEAAEDTVIPTIWKALLAVDDVSAAQVAGELPLASQDHLGSVLVPTGVKAFMPDDEYLLLANRSSNPMKRGLVLPNGIGVIDADYYGNGSNEGEIFVQLINYGRTDYIVKKGDRIAQGIFTPYKTVSDEQGAELNRRSGGFGSSGR